MGDDFSDDVKRAARVWLRVLDNATRPPPTRAHCILFDEATRAAGYRTGSREQRMSGQWQCEATRCEHNLVVERSGDRPGRRHHGLAPESTIKARGKAGSPSCVLDVADTGPKSAAEIAEIEGFEDKRRVEQQLKEAKSGEVARLIARLRDESDE